MTCYLCNDRGTVDVPYQTAYEADMVETIPCPKCQLYVPLIQLHAVNVQVEQMLPEELVATAEQHIRHDLAHTLIDLAVNEGAVEFTSHTTALSPIAYAPVTEYKATMLVAKPIANKQFEQMINQAALRRCRMSIEQLIDQIATCQVIGRQAIAGKLQDIINQWRTPSTANTTSSMSTNSK